MMETQSPNLPRRIPYKSYVEKVIRKDGPNPDQYKTLLFAFSQLELELESGIADQEDIQDLLHLFEGDFFLETLMGHAHLKPYGYNGDFELLDKISEMYFTQNTKYQKWDLFFQHLSSMQSLRTRKHFFPKLIQSTDKKNRKGLIVSGGPYRELNTSFLQENKVSVDCLDNDIHGIAHATNITETSPLNIHFIKKNPFRFVPEKKYDFIWIPFLFDFAEDKLFLNLIKRFLNFLEPNGQLAFASLIENEDEKPFLEIFCEWFTTTRDQEHQQKLFKLSNLDHHKIRFKTTKNTLFTNIRLANQSWI